MTRPPFPLPEIESNSCNEIFSDLAIDLTRGELGTRGNAKIRTSETKKSTEIMGVKIRENMDFKDGFFKEQKSNLFICILGQA